MKPERRVVVTGLGVLAPNAHGLPAFAGALREGKSGIRFHPALKESGFGCQVGGIPENVEAIQKSYLSEEELFAMNPNMIYAAIAAIDAWTDAGLARPALGEDVVHWDTGAIIGTGIGGIDTIAEKLAPKTDAGKVSRLGSTMVEQVMSSGNSARIAGLLALGNQVTTNSSACNTGTEAIVDAFLRIREGRAERMLAGGSEGHSKYIWAGFDAMKVLNRTKNEAPAEASRPMSASAAGFVPGSGAGVLMLESLSSAERRGARIYAEVRGGFVNCGGHRMGGSMTAPNPEGVSRCIRGAVEMAGIRPEQIDAINGHLTATFADPLEVANWSRALELPPARMPLIHSTKSLIGHALGAAGGIECVAAVLELHHGFVHGSINCDDLHPELSAYADRIVHRTVDRSDLALIAKASFGFGDVNGCLIFEKFGAERR
ncbi:MAG: beta-ketoacyl-[acyl-carrier-protein] synthase family protein [Deltaproteobacteria bacterium]|nr:beta-ketoacyl-[acyl-carrier-protein] synthase family protein [Deltaproteobacteria bacterium]